MKALGLALSVLVSISATGHDAKADGYGFIDTTSGASAALLTDPPRLVMQEEGIGVEYCGKKSEFHCFTTQKISFAVPRDRAKRRSWSHDGRLYCVVRSYAATKGSNAVNDTHLIFSGVVPACDSTIGFDTSAVYSDVQGLRLIRSKLPSGELVELYSLEFRGFGVR